nr:hypothetical protein [Liquorilactobacillus mali]
MIRYRIFNDKDAEEVSTLVRQTMLTTNIKDYSREYLENDLRNLTAKDFIEKGKFFH